MVVICLRIQESWCYRRDVSENVDWRVCAENRSLLVGSLLRLLPDGIDLVFYLGYFLEVSTSFMVGYLGGEFVDFLLVFLGKSNFDFLLLFRHGLFWIRRKWSDELGIIIWNNTLVRLIVAPMNDVFVHAPGNYEQIMIKLLVNIFTHHIHPYSIQPSRQPAGHPSRTSIMMKGKEKENGRKVSAFQD